MTHKYTHDYALTPLSSSTWSSVLSSPNCWRNNGNDENLEGSKKLRRLNSSSTLFCNGVPVNSTLCSYITNINDYNIKHHMYSIVFTICISLSPSNILQFLFFNRCASSKMATRQRMFNSSLLSANNVQ